MKLSHLQQYLNESITPENFLAEIESEVASYKSKLSKKGASADVVLEDDLQGFIFTAKDLNFLDEQLQKKVLSRYHLSYLADALLLAQFAEKLDFENEDLIDELEEFSLAEG